MDTLGEGGNISKRNLAKWEADWAYNFKISSSIFEFHPFASCMGN